MGIPTSSSPVTPPRFQWRAAVSVVMTAAFLALAISGLMLFLSPPGRIANWTNWTLLGLTKAEWTALHIWFSALFLAGSILHLFFNWRPLLSYFKDRATRQLTLRREWLAGLALCAIIAAGTLAALPPFSSLLAWNQSFKESWEQPVAAAPIPHAELLTLAELAAKAGVPLPEAKLRLAAKDVTGFSDDSLVRDVAEKAGVAPQRIYEIIRTARAAQGAHTPGAGGGPGSKTLAQFCAAEGIAVDVALARLTARGYQAGADLTLREIANRNGLEKPYGLLDVIRGQ